MTPYDVASSYMVLGGISYYLGYFKMDKSVAENIDEPFFEKNAHLKYEFDRLFLSSFDNSDFAEKMVRLLSTRRKGDTRNEIAKNLKVAMAEIFPRQSMHSFTATSSKSMFLSVNRARLWTIDLWIHFVSFT